VQREQRAHDAEGAADEDGAPAVEARADHGERDTGGRGGKSGEADGVEVHTTVDLDVVSARGPLDEGREPCRDGPDREDREEPLFSRMTSLVGRRPREL
jgi:hypothetical protein